MRYDYGMSFESLKAETAALNGSERFRLRLEMQLELAKRSSPEMELDTEQLSEWIEKHAADFAEIEVLHDGRDLVALYLQDPELALALAEKSLAPK